MASDIQSIQWEGLQQMFCSSGNYSLTIWKKGVQFEVTAVDRTNPKQSKLMFYEKPVEIGISEIFPPEGYFREASGKIVVKGHGQGRLATLRYSAGGVDHSVVIGNCEYLISE